MNKNDLEELEKWNTQRVINEKEKSKFYFEEFNKNKRMEKFTKGLGITITIVRIIVHIIIGVAIFIGLKLLLSGIMISL